MAKSRYRSRLDIIADVLSVTGDSARKTKIMFGANLSFNLVNRYLAEVLKADLVSVNDGRYYFITDRGKEFLKRYGEYSRLKRSAEEATNSIQVVRADLERLCWSDLLKENSRRGGLNQRS